MMTAVGSSPKTGFRALWRNRNFRLLWLGQIISNFGDSLAGLALLAGLLVTPLFRRHTVPAPESGS